MNSTVVIREALASDAKSLFHIRAVIWREVAQFDRMLPSDIEAYLPSKKEGIREEEAKLTQPSTVCFVAVRNRKVIGYCRAQRGETVNHIKAFYVLPKWRSQGIGTALLEHILKEIRDKEVQLYTYRFNPASHRFYRRHAFKETGRVKDTARHGAIEFASGAVFQEIEFRLRKETRIA